MDNRVSLLLKAFEENGWEMAEVILDGSSEWWFEERWLLESTWRPLGRQVYLTALRDPQATHLIWAVGISREIPQTRLYDFERLLPLNDISKTDLKQVVNGFNDNY